MAYILRSNISVNDPEGRFPFYGRYGITHKELAIFMQDMEQQGYTVEQSEFTALDTFITNLKSNLLWDKIHEVYPMMGNSLNSSLVKLKEFNSAGRLMTTLGGFDESLLEFSGGKVVGKKVTSSSSAANAPRIDTGVSTLSLLPGAGFHALCGLASGEGEASLTQPIMGALNGDSGSQPATGLAMNMGDLSNRSGFISTGGESAAYTNDLAVLGYVGRPNPSSIGTSAFKDYYIDGVTQIYGGGPQAFSGDTDVTIALCGRNASVGATASSTSNGYSGVFRFGCITDGYWTEQQVQLLHNEISTLTTELGKLG